MRRLEDLINLEESGWVVVNDWIKDATNQVEVLEKDSIKAKTILYQSQITTRSPMGAIIYESGGILIDNGWIRILGSGSKRLDRSITEWNKGKSYLLTGDSPSYFLVADDVLGGFFAINSGGICESNIGKIFYFAPDCLKWENTELSYSEFLIFCFKGDLNLFYEGLRWENWKSEITQIGGNEGIFCLPFLWTEEGKNINAVNRKIVPIQELWDLYQTSKEDK